MDVRVGILGFGMRSRLANYAHRPGEGSSIVAVCDSEERGRADAVSRFGPGVAVVADIPALLAHELDAVLILTPDYLHEEHALQTLEAGIATFLEKPIAITIEGADRVLECAFRTGTKLYVGHNMRHLPAVGAMRQAIERGKIGEVKAVWCRHFVSAGGDYYFKDWHADRNKSTGLLLQKGAHDLDVIHWLAGGYSVRASAIGTLAVYGDVESRRDNGDRRMGDWYDESNWPPASQSDLAPKIDVEDISMANFVLDNGVLASYQQCHFTPDYWRNYTVIGTEGRLENFGDSASPTIKIWNTRSDVYREASDETITVPLSEGGHGGADPALIAEFLRFAREGGRTIASPLAARHAVAAGVAATKSLRSGGLPVDIPMVSPEVERYFLANQERVR